MILTAENLFHYLWERKIVNVEKVVEGDFMVLPVFSRNNLFKVFSQSGDNLFIKQASFKDPSSITMLKREAKVYQFLKKNTQFSHVISQLPNYIDYDDERHVLITEYIADSKSMHDFYLTNRQFDPQHAIMQAKILSSYLLPAENKEEFTVFPFGVPWVLQICDLNAYQFFPQCKESGDFITIIQNHVEFKRLLSELKNIWSKTHLIHGDVKWVNFILYNKNATEQQCLIDWELADIGDPCWDVAGLLQSYLSTWVFSLDNSDPLSIELKTGLKEFEIENMQASIQAFWKAYCELQGATREAKVELLLKCIKYVAARVIQTSIEGVVYSSKIVANNMRSIQLAFNILKDPPNASIHLLGIKL